MSAENNGNLKDVPWWIRIGFTYGLPSVLCMYLLGMLPFLPPPFTTAAAKNQEAAAAQLKQHDDYVRNQRDELVSLIKDHIASNAVELKAVRRAVVSTCQGTWWNVDARRVRDCGVLD